MSPPASTPSPDAPAFSWSPPLQADGGLPGYPWIKVLECIGRGGFGAVFKATDERLQRAVAVKFILSRKELSAADRQALLAEPTVQAGISDPHVLVVHDVGEVGAIPFYTMELCDSSLARLLGGRPLPVRFAVSMAINLATAVHRIHQRGYVHLDLKPGNILLHAFPQSEAAVPAGAVPVASPVEASAVAAWLPKIGDFGLAKHLDAGEAGEQDSEMGGTPCYMAPEQHTRSQALVGPATDVYALGAILYEMLTGRAPFAGTSSGRLKERVFGSDPPSPSHVQPGLPEELDAICAKCLERRPRQRYASAAELASALARFLNGGGHRGPVLRWIVRQSKHATWSRVWGAAALLAIVAAALWSIWPEERSSLPPPDDSAANDAPPQLKLHDDFSAPTLDVVKWHPEFLGHGTIKADGVLTLHADGLMSTRHSSQAFVVSRGFVKDAVELDVTPTCGPSQCFGWIQIGEEKCCVRVRFQPDGKGAMTLSVEQEGLPFHQQPAQVAIRPDTTHRIRFVKLKDSVIVYHNGKALAKLAGAWRPHARLRAEVQSEGVRPLDFKRHPLSPKLWTIVGDVDHKAEWARLWMFRNGVRHRSEISTKDKPGGENLGCCQVCVDRLGDNLKVAGQAESFVELTNGMDGISLHWLHHRSQFAIKWTGAYGSGEKCIDYRNPEGRLVIRNEEKDFVIRFNDESIKVFANSTARPKTYFRVSAEGRIGEGGLPLQVDYAIRLKEVLLIPSESRTMQMAIDNVCGEFTAPS